MFLLDYIFMSFASFPQSYTLFFLPGVIIVVTFLVIMSMPRKNYLLYLICLEFMIAGVNLAFIFVTILNADPLALTYSAFILGIASAEVALGIAIILLLYDKRNTITIRN
jgi:NADH:ubiquinone oxidoreductase subunit K